MGCKKTIEKDDSLAKDEQSITSSSNQNPLAGSREFCDPTTFTSGSGETGNPMMSKVVAQSTIVYYTDYVSAGVGGLRDVGSGTIALAGLSGTVTKAYLYWHGVTNSSTDVGNSITVNATTVIGSNIGVSSSNCWAFANSQAYRANVTNINLFSRFYSNISN